MAALVPLRLRLAPGRFTRDSHGPRRGDEQSGGCRAQTGLNASLVWSPLQAMDGLHPNYLRRNHPQIATKAARGIVNKRAFRWGANDLCSLEIFRGWAG